MQTSFTAILLSVFCLFLGNVGIARADSANDGDEGAEELSDSQVGDADDSACDAAKPDCNDLHHLTQIHDALSQVHVSCHAIRELIQRISDQTASDTWHDSNTRRCYAATVVNKAQECPGHCPENCALPRHRGTVAAAMLDWAVPAAKANTITAFCGVCKRTAPLVHNSMMTALNQLIGRASCSGD